MTEDGMQARYSGSDGDSLSTVRQFFHKINVFMLLEDHFAASLFPPAIAASLTRSYDLSARHVPNYLHLNTVLVHKAPICQPGTSFCQDLPLQHSCGYLCLCATCPAHPCQVVTVKSWILRTTHWCSCLTLRFAFCLPDKSLRPSV